VGDATVGAVSPTSVSSPEETGMASVGGTRPTKTASVAVLSGLASAPGVSWATSVASWVVSWAAWGRDEAPADDPTPCFTALVEVKDGSWAWCLVLKQDKMLGKRRSLTHGKISFMVLQLTQIRARRPTSVSSSSNPDALPWTSLMGQQPSPLWALGRVPEAGQWSGPPRAPRQMRGRGNGPLLCITHSR
jgi:hypothetical protein